MTGVTPDVRARDRRVLSHATEEPPDDERRVSPQTRQGYTCDRCQGGVGRVVESRTLVSSQAASPVNCTRTIGLWAMAASNDTALR
jgi:hypothetical protein